jgi:hypothetical protein
VGNQSDKAQKKKIEDGNQRLLTEDVAAEK